MSRAKPWEDDPRFDHPDTRVDRTSNTAMEAVTVRYPDGAARSWYRDRRVPVRSVAWEETTALERARHVAREAAPYVATDFHETPDAVVDALAAAGLLADTGPADPTPVTVPPLAFVRLPGTDVEITHDLPRNVPMHYRRTQHPRGG